MDLHPILRLFLLLTFFFTSNTKADPLDVLPDYFNSPSYISGVTNFLDDLYWTTVGRLTPAARIKHELFRYETRIREHYGWKNVTLHLHEYPKVCDARLGCIQLQMPSENVSTVFEAVQRLKMKATQFIFLPFSPEKIQTKFIAYKAEDSEKEIEIVTTNASTFSGVIDPKRRVVFLTHGFTDHYQKPSLQSIKGSLLRYSKGEVGTVIMVDWHKGSYYAAIKNFTSDDYYSQAVANTQVIGRQIADLVNELKLNIGLNPADVYLVGHSLGAQTSSIAGSWGRKTFGWTIGRVTGLDPAGPLFYLFETYLKAGDADFVDIIHTSAFREQSDALIGRLGYPNATGDLDFFPSSGTDMPNCVLGPGEVIDPSAPSCTHQSALWFYDASLNSTSVCQFRAYPADNYTSFLSNSKALKSDTVMGYWANRKAKGVRYLQTAKDFPYCLVE